MPARRFLRASFLGNRAKPGIDYRQLAECAAVAHPPAYALRQGGSANGSAVSAYLGRLSSRHALAAARPVHNELVEQNEGLDAVRRRECGWRQALDRQ